MKYLFFLLLLTSCVNEPDKMISVNDRKFKIVDIDPPKRMYVDLEDVITKKVYTGQYVAKRCASYEKLQLNSLWTFPVVTYQRKDGSTYEEIRGVDKLCDFLDRLK